MLRRVSGLDLLQQLDEYELGYGETKQTSSGGTARSGTFHVLAGQWKTIVGSLRVFAQIWLDSTSKKTSVVGTRVNSSSTATVHLRSRVSPKAVSEEQ